MKDQTNPLHRARLVRTSLPRRLSFIAALLPLLAACSAGAMQVSKSASDPSSPSAPDGADPMLAASSAPAPTSSSSPQHHDHAGHDHAGHTHTGAPSDGSPSGAPSTSNASAGDVVYACPMHPEVTSTKPGEVCPKCNMKLVPKK